MPDFCRVFKNTRRLKDMIQYILNGKNSLGQVDSHIEDYRTKERMEEEFARIKEVYRNNPHAEMTDTSRLRWVG